MHALELLERDHQEVKKLLARGDDTTERAVKTRTDVLGKLKREMDVHEAIEEQIFYPALQQHDEAKDLVLEGFEEHHVVDQLVEELESTDVDDERWAAKFSVMKENIEHHIEEEEGEMFEIARKVLDDDRLTELGEKMAERKKQLGG